MVLPATSSARVVRWLTFLVDVREAWMVQAAASYTPYDLSSSGMVMGKDSAVKSGGGVAKLTGAKVIIFGGIVKSFISEVQ